MAAVDPSKRGFHWYLSILLSGGFAFGIGYQFVAILRKKYKSSKNMKKFTTAIFATPFLIYIILSFFAFVRLIDRSISDAISFGIVFGIMLQLAMKPNGPGSIKLIAQQVNGKHVDVWLDSLNVHVGEARNRIAEALGITPTRVSIESGKGSFIEDMTIPFLDNIDDTLKKTDFFGFVTLYCYISVKEEEKKKVVFADDTTNEQTKSGDKKTHFLNLLVKPEIKFGEFLVCNGRIASAESSKTTFQISYIEKFVAAAPASNLLINNTTMRLHPWKSDASNGGGANADDQSEAPNSPNPNSDAFSDIGDGNSVASGPNGARMKKRGSIFFQKKKDENDYFGKTVHHGDIVVVECNGKYMSVTRGWWMSWSSNEPRRSGAFYIEIVEKARDKLKEQFENIKENIKEKIGRSKDKGEDKEEKEMDNILRPGDVFRLRSVKFPDFELGLTSVKLRDEYCYLGLRKMGSQEVSDDNAWCMEMRFVFRNANDILNLISNK